VQTLGYGVVAMPSRLLAACIACALAAPMTASAHAPSRLEQGEAALERGEYRSAAEAFGDHYRDLAKEQRASEVGEHVVMYAAEVYGKAWAKDAAVEDLEASRALLSEFVRDVETVHGADRPELTEAARAEIEELDAKIAAASAGEPEPVPEPVAAPERAPQDTTPDPAPTSASPPDRSGTDPLGIALVASGATIAAGGIAMLAAGLAGATARRAEGRLDERCEQDGADAMTCAQAQQSDDARAFVARAERSDRTVALASIGPLVVGIALVVGGSVRLTRRRSHARIGWGAWADAEGSGTFVGGRF
jgi:hypothetical protein